MAEVSLSRAGRYAPFRRGRTYDRKRDKIYSLALAELRKSGADLDMLRLASHRIGRILVWDLPESVMELPRGYRAETVRDERTLSLDGFLFSTLGPLHLLAQQPQLERLAADLMSGLRREIEAMEVDGEVMEEEDL
jgi:hypothetical protein